jgi:hypothetical protein
MVEPPRSYHGHGLANDADAMQIGLAESKSLSCAPNGERATLLEDECDWSTPGLCTACDERLRPELKSLLDIWHQLGATAMAYRTHWPSAA